MKVTMCHYYMALMLCRYPYLHWVPKKLLFLQNLYFSFHFQLIITISYFSGAFEKKNRICDQFELLERLQDLQWRPMWQPLMAVSKNSQRTHKELHLSKTFRAGITWLLQPDLPSNWSSLNNLNCTHSSCESF